MALRQNATHKLCVVSKKQCEAEMGTILLSVEVVREPEVARQGRTWEATIKVQVAEEAPCPGQQRVGGFR